jgi:type I restriction enzyme R subunit
MVVTSSRLHAVRYTEALDRYGREHGYRLGVLVAFSGTVFDEGEPRTEANINHFLDTQTTAEFDTDT